MLHEVVPWLRLVVGFSKLTPVSIPGRSIWDFFLDNRKLWQGCLRLLHSSPASIIPPLLRNHISFIYYNRHYIILATVGVIKQRKSLSCCCECYMPRPPHPPNHVWLRVRLKVTPWEACAGTRGDGGIPPTHWSTGARRKWVISAALQPLNSGDRAITHLAGGWVSYGARLDGMKNLASARIWSLGRPAPIDLIYRLHYPDRQVNCKDY
jgi:hypothetical protein